jgi:outer membrane protein assembly factor BamD (BamD/ComL family)
VKPAIKRDGGKIVSSAKKGKDSYPTEGLALDAAQEALDRKDAAKATAILDQYEKDFGSAGLLGPDARAERIEAMALLKQDAQALALSAKFLEDYPHSPKADRVRGIADQLRARAAK